MEKKKHALIGWLAGLVGVLLVILAFILITKCQPGFFQGFSPVF